VLPNKEKHIAPSVPAPHTAYRLPPSPNLQLYIHPNPSRNFQVIRAEKKRKENTIYMKQNKRTQEAEPEANKSKKH
jgi:hypothetical protein